MIVTFKIMPRDDDVDITLLENEVKKICLDYGLEVQIVNSEIVEMSFGIKAVNIKIKFDETLGTSNLEDNLNKLETVSSVEVLKMDRI